MRQTARRTRENGPPRCEGDRSGAVVPPDGFDDSRAVLVRFPRELPALAHIGRACLPARLPGFDPSGFPVALFASRRKNRPSFRSFRSRFRPDPGEASRGFLHLARVGPPFDEKIPATPPPGLPPPMLPENYR